jgi:hypothetical protein
MTSDALILIPLPSALEPLQRLVQAWALTHPEVLRVFLYGSTLRMVPDPRDLDLAVEYVNSEYQHVLDSLMDDRPRWADELTRLTGRPVHLEIAHPVVSDRVWSYLQQGCAILFDQEGQDAKDHL